MILKELMMAFQMIVPFYNGFLGDSIHSIVDDGWIYSSPSHVPKYPNQ